MADIPPSGPLWGDPDDDGVDLDPEDAAPNLCMFCGAYSPRTYDLIDDTGFCAWEEMEEAHG